MKKQGPTNPTQAQADIRALRRNACLASVGPK